MRKSYSTFISDQNFAKGILFDQAFSGQHITNTGAISSLEFPQQIFGQNVTSK